MLRAWLLAEAGAVDDHDMLLSDKLLDEDFVALRNVDPRKGVERAAGGDAAYARRGLAPLLSEIATGTQLALHFNEMILRAFERGLDRVLLGMIGAEARTQQAVDGFGIGLYGSGFTGDDAPSNAPSGDEIVLRHAAERHAGHVGRNRRKSDVWRVFQNQFVVDFVGKYDQVVAARQFRNLLQHLPRAQRAGGIVGINQNDAARPRRELAFDVGELGLPRVIFIEIVSIDRNPQLAQDCRVQRVVGLRRENVFAGIHQCGDAQIDSLADTGGDENVLHGRDALTRSFAANCFERFWNTRGWRVSVFAVAHRFVHGFDDVGRSLEVEVERVANVQWQDLVSLFDDLVGYAGQIADGIADVVEAGGGGDLAGLRRGHGSKNLNHRGHRETIAPMPPSR